MRFPGPLTAAVLPSDLASLLIFGVAGMIAVLFGLWIYYDRRDRAFFDATRHKATFHCLKCSCLYTAVAEGNLNPCPRCGHPNPPLRF